MKITVKFFAILKDRAGVSETTLTLYPGSTASYAGESLIRQFPAIKKFLPKVAYAINQEYVPADTELHDGDELALIPPVSGDEMETNFLVDLLETPLNVEEAIAFVSSSRAGATDLFLGTTRAEINTAGHSLLALDYEAYEAMARKQLRQLSDSAQHRWPVNRLVILHRIGRVGVGQASVLIAVSTPHRADAFDCCRWIIEQLKKEVTLWKKEIWDEGDGTWVHPPNA